MLKKALRALASFFQPDDSEGPGYPVLCFEGPGYIKVDPTDIFRSPEFKEQLEQVRQIADNGG